MKIIAEITLRSQTDHKRKQTKKQACLELAEKIERYFTEYLAVSGEIADIESLAEYLGTTRDELLALMNDKKLGPTLKRARNRIAMIKKQLAFNGKIPASVLSFDLKNNHGYRDKPEESEADQGEQIIFKGKAAEWAK